MGKYLKVYYYPTEKDARNARIENRNDNLSPIDGEGERRERKYYEAVARRREFSRNMARNWKLLDDYYLGSRRSMMEEIHRMWNYLMQYNTEGASNSEDEDSVEDTQLNYQLESISNMTRIVSECPNGWWIEIRND